VRLSYRLRGQDLITTHFVAYANIWPIFGGDPIISGREDSIHKAWAGFEGHG
jgi:hypothetical protein